MKISSNEIRENLDEIESRTGCTVDQFNEVVGGKPNWNAVFKNEGVGNMSSALDELAALKSIYMEIEF